MTVKVAINRRFGGFGLSPEGLRRLAELQGRECYIFEGGLSEPYRRVDAPASIFWTAFDVPELAPIMEMDWAAMEPDQRREQREWYEAHHMHHIDDSPRDRTDPLLIQVIEELGAIASGQFADLRVVEVPSDAEWEIDEYDGMETIHEKHRVWGEDL